MRVFLCVSMILALGGCLSSEADTPVRVSLDEGQVLVGQVATDVLVLDSELGQLDIPLSDIGEVEPVEGQDLAGSGDHVRVWLRDGSELVGQWREPELDVELAIGGTEQTVGLPMATVQRMQLTSQAAFPEDGAFRVRTAFGDDIFVDAEETALPMDTALGSLAPRLDEIASLTPLSSDAGTWRVELVTGTVLNGTVEEDSLTLALAVGPPSVEVRIDDLLSIERMHYDPHLWKEAPAESLDLAAPASSHEKGWYSVSSSGMRAQKQQTRSAADKVQ